MKENHFGYGERNTIDKFHCCAACVHFGIVKHPSPVTYRCIRLGFETKPTYQFQCWEPKEQVKKLMEKRK